MRARLSVLMVFAAGAFLGTALTGAHARESARADTALVIIDIQNFYFDGGRLPLVGSVEASEKARELLLACRAQGIPVIHVRHLPKNIPLNGTGLADAQYFIHPNVAPLAGEKVIGKHYANSFRETELKDDLSQMGVRRLIVCGMQTHMCVEATTRAAADFGFEVIVAEDACATRNLKYKDVEIDARHVHAAALAALKDAYAQIATTAEIIKSLVPAPPAGTRGRAAVNVGSRLEPFFDDYLIERMAGTRLCLQHPVSRDVAIVFDKPWEGNTSTYVTVFKDGDLFRMYYRGSNYDPATEKYSDQNVCYAESRDGLRFEKPELGLFAYEGSKKNNVVWQGLGSHNFAPFKDANPACAPDEKYKAVASDDKNNLYAFKSPDGLHWSLLRPEPIITGSPFDSLNLAFWDAAQGRYLEFHRDLRNKVRDIMTGSSADFLNWTKPQWLDYGDAPVEHLYTNAITPYFRAPHILIGFPKRFMPERKVGTHKLPGVSEGVFMSSRDGLHWKRWAEAFLRPGLQKERWVNRNNLIAWGIVQTESFFPGAPYEISLYSTEGYYVKDCRMRRHTVRLDGFVSVRADAKGGEMVTKPLIFKGSELVINYSTSAAGSVRVEVQNEPGEPIPGFSLDDAPEIYGDDVEYVVPWKAGASLASLSGKPVRLRFAMKDADLYSVRFR